MTPALVESIALMQPVGNRLNLPAEQLGNYPAVKKCLLSAGGKYKRGGFDFTECATALQARLVGGEAIDDVKKYQYYPTPHDLALLMIQRAGVEKGMRCLEPSAGQGAILIPMMQVTGLRKCVGVELMPQNVKVLSRLDVAVHRGDFLKMDPSGYEPFDRIVANPPFTKNQDIDHVRHMYTFLKPGGRLVALMSPHHTFADDKKSVGFRQWLSDVGAAAEPIPAGVFKASGTNIATVMVVMDKPS